MSTVETLVRCAVLAALAGCQPTIGDAPGIGGNRPDPVDAGEGIIVFDAPPFEPAPDSGGGGSDEVTLRQTTSEQILAQNSIACVEQDADGNAVQNRQNSYYRAFELADFGVTTDVAVETVRFGVESATSVDGSQPVTLILYTLDGPLLLENLSEIGRAAVSVTDQDQTVIETDLTATAPAGSTLVAEILIPDSSTNDLMFIGSNTLGETTPGFIRAPAAGCDLIEPSTFPSVSADPIHLVLSVTGRKL